MGTSSKTWWPEDRNNEQQRGDGYRILRDAAPVRFHPGRFPDPQAMMRELHGLGFKVMGWVYPCFSP